MKTLKEVGFSGFLKKSWPLTKKHYWKFLGAFLLVIVIESVVNSLTSVNATTTTVNTAFGPVTQKTSSSPLNFIDVLVQQFLSMNMMFIFLKIARNQQVTIHKDLLTNFDRFIKLFIAMILLVLVIVGGLILLIVPGIIFALKFAYVPYLIVDKNLGIIESFKTSSRMLKGSKGSFFLYGLGMGLINILGVLAVFVGLLVTIPLTSIAMTLMYLHLLPNASLAAKK